jgi:hypothetical protein
MQEMSGRTLPIRVERPDASRSPTDETKEHLMKRFLKSLFASARADAGRSTALRKKLRARLQVERLEDRMVPTVQAFPVVGGVLTVNGDQLLLPTNDIIDVATSPAGGVSVTLNNENVTFAPGKVTSIVINPGGSFNGFNHVYIESTNVPVTINDCDPRGDIVMIGQNSTLQGIHAPVTLQNGSFNTSLTVDDVGDPSYRNISISAHDVKVSGVPDISFYNLYLHDLTVAAGGPQADIPGNGGNYIGISSIDGQDLPTIPPRVQRNNGTIVAVYTGFGENTVVAGPRLDAFRGWLTVNGQGLSNSLTIDDSGDLGARNYVLEESNLSSSGMPDLLSFHSIDRLYITGASGPDTFLVDSVPLTSVTFLNGGMSNMNTLAGPLGTVDWFVSGPFQGFLAVNGAPTNVYFENMQNLHGSTGVDTFEFAMGGVVQSIDGGGGGDWLDYHMFDNAHPVAVNLTNGTATNVLGSIANIQNVLGGNGNDLLTGGPGGNILIGGGGSNTLVGGPDGNLLIGGFGQANTLTAGAFGDILIGGWTDFDSSSDAHRAELQSILDEWRFDAPWLRIPRLTTGNFWGQGLNGNNLLNDITVHDNLAADVLNAGMALDWIFRHKGFMGGYSDIVNAPPNNNDVFYYY